MDYVKIYLVMAAVFLVLDGLWLGLLAKNFYKKYIGHLMASKPNFIAAGVFYLLFLVGLLILVVVPAGRDQALNQVLWSGALFGLVTYGTYDLTSHAIIKKWPAQVTIADLVWGTFVTTVVSLSGYWIASGLLG